MKTRTIVNFFSSVVLACVALAACGSDPTAATGTTGDASSSSASASSGTGGEVPALGASPAIVAFQDSRKATQQDPAIVAAIDAQTATANMVDLSPDVEARRVAYVLDWTVDDYEQAWADHAGFTFAPGQAPRSPAQAGVDSKAFEDAATATLAALPAQSWDAQWDGFTAGFLAAQATVKHPVEWTEARAHMLPGALKAAKIGAIKAGAADINAAFASIGPVGAKLSAVETKGFDALAAMK
jgi:hypothetical protein